VLNEWIKCGKYVTIYSLMESVCGISYLL